MYDLRSYVRPDWYLMSSHGAVLLFIVTHPECTICEIADAMCLTQGTISNLIGDLRQAGMLRVSRDGRRNNYTVNLDAVFRLPGQRAFPLRVLVGDLVEDHTGEVRVPHEPVRSFA